MANDDIHSGHRERVRARFLKEGIENFEDHQILELLLFYSVPRRDTNVIAHKLLSKFGSLAGVLEAKPSELMKVEGVGENSAVLLSVLPGVFRKYAESGLSKKTTLNSVDEAGKYAVNLMRGRTNEAFFAVFLNSGGEVIASKKISEGTVSEAPVYPRLIVEAALENKARMVIVTHNHPGGSTYPSDSDINVTEKIRRALETVDIVLRDHIIVTSNGYFSFKNMRML